ncbi:PREDICTED: uncharacterized protein LOC105455029 [Wasmannia auropunctata]|uniref:uncharacterized protein LOC105455029 n=1 Tax=Wasmannia auropunctata TaxID=64793 RepID=UPI0005EF50B3|nr:PREDICTED: uncharacterized protein LOC105455029 [Wasmannia auropunctata]
MIQPVKAKSGHDPNQSRQDLDMIQPVKNSARFIWAYCSCARESEKGRSRESHTGAVETRIKLLDSNWEKFEATHDVLRSSHWKSISEHDYTKNDFYGCVEETYVAQRTAFADLLEELKGKAAEELSASLSSQGEGSARRTLPRIQLPSFSGKFEEWPAFKDLFLSIIHGSSSLSEVEKLHYLRTCLKGEADQLVRNVPSTTENYERVWTMLTDHYENKRLLVRACFSAFTALPKMKGESVTELRRLFHGMLQTIGSLEGIGRPITNCSDLFVHLIVEMLDPRSRQEWETNIGGTSGPPSCDELKEFLESRLRTLEALHPSGNDSSEKTGNPAPRTARSHFAQKTFRPTKCSLCQKKHYILTCPEFQGKSAQQQRDYAEANNLCLNCFGKHKLSTCPSRKSCAACKQRHHSSIHDVCATAKSDGVDAPSSLHVHNTEGERATVLLATARVTVTNKYGTPRPARALVTESFVQRLRLRRSPSSTVIFGVGGQETGVSRGKVMLTLTSCVTCATIHVAAFILPRISVYGGRVGSTETTWPHVRDLPLADPSFRSGDSIDILLGADVYSEIVENGLRKGQSGTPVAQRTSLGWILSGVIGSAGPREPVASHQCSADEDLAALVRAFWEQEELTPTARPLADDDRRCEEHFASTHRRLACGRYLVRLPTGPILPPLEDSRKAALRTLNSMERKFASNVDFHAMYSEFLKEYEALQHMSLAPPPEQARRPRTCYLPHHGVTKMSGDVARIRVVFNGSARLASGDALNRALLTGPNLLPALADILSHWRVHRFAMATDIEKMYRQVLVHEDDRDLQHILWRTNPTEPIKEYRLNTVTYGLTYAPYLAIRTLRQLADDEEKRFPLAAMVLRRDVYVDDILTGADTLAKARYLRDELIQLCAAGGFPLRKWATNDDELLKDIPVNHRQRDGLLEWEPDTSHSTLGLQWHPLQDAFAYKVRPCEERSVTKRAYCPKQRDSTIRWAGWRRWSCRRR